MARVARLHWVPSLADSLARMASVSEHLQSDVGPLDGEWVAYADLLSEHSPLRDALLAGEAERCPGLDAKGQVAFLLGGVAHYVLIVLAPLLMLGRQVPLLQPDRLAFRTRQVPYQHGGETLTYQAIDWRFLSEQFWTDQHGELPHGGFGVASAQALRAQLNAQLEVMFEPLIARLKSISKLSQGAQWRIVADSLAGAFLSTGQAINLEAQACAEADALIADPLAAIHNSKTGFVEIAVDHPSKPGQPIRRTYRARGGCCRYYTADSGHLCATCVLIKPDERDERLRNHLRHHAHD
ncbi:(2Fe-2S)-binding protein [Saccharospirillum mangrovi]|uniref:(2Fe-2S)-binding protein n=1 Tax=Saccharospirillum mangrovi TaxID=2161747 RepID=UPI000D3503BF|nr:(2Fe-2S)-binding protein [Saccharospirillum mangrovi]